MNLVIFPLLSVPEEKILDTRLFYTPREAGSYILQLDHENRRKSLIMHGTVDMLYPAIYTLLFSSIIAVLRGNPGLISLPLLILLADLVENLSIILLIAVSSKSALYNFFSITAALSTPLKWGLVGISSGIILFLLSRRIYEK
ncbi:MAG: hypothetical protein L3J12_03955 [Spirochaetales bacterium]|nr:hypothetical protein [Spirochaetales bacterium]